MYQIYPRSFADSNGDGVGDLPGITAHLDDLAWLGVDGVWISPFFRSPMHDAGYDVADYCDVDPVFGTLDDIDTLVAEAHARGLKVMIDWVPAHTSNEHPWFVEASASRDSAKRNWYVWRDPGPNGELPNNWQAAFKKVPAWSLHEPTGQLYLHSFLKEQPDLNWNEPAVVEAMHDTLRFWLDRGIDGFRADVVHNIGKDEALADHPEHVAKIPHCALNDDPLTHGHLREIRKLLDAYPGDRAMIGEVFLLSTEQVAAYYGEGDELHMSFNFPPLFAAWDAAVWREQIESAARLFDPIGAWPTWVLSNHDQKRHRTRYGSLARARVAAMLLLTLRGTPFMYQGEELGLEDAVVPPERVVDPADRDGCRAPVPWLREPGHGWPDPSWLPLPPEAGARSHEAQRDDADSMLHLYKRLLAERRASAALREGAIELLDCGEGQLAYRRSAGRDERIVVLDMGGEGGRFDAGAGRTVEACTDRAREGAAFDGQVPADAGFILA